MSYLTYKFIHISGIIMLLTSMGGLCFHVIAGGDKENFKARKFFGMTHGIALVVSLVGGFGLLARLGTSALEGWVIAKFCIWVLFGGYSALIYRTSHLAKLHWVIIVALGMTAAFLAQNKPF
jgi:uncharacterized membrane protein